MIENNIDFKNMEISQKKEYVKVVNPCIEIIQGASYDEMKYVTETAIRNCYRSTDKIKPGSDEKIIRGCGNSGHTSTFEHCVISVRLIMDCGILGEITRHRTGIAFSVESSRYCNYMKDKFENLVHVIMPYEYYTQEHLARAWYDGMEISAKCYEYLIDNGSTVDSARSVLPNALKTDVICTANIREWLHMFNLRCSDPAHYQFRQVMKPLLGWMYNEYPVFFKKYHEIYKDSIFELGNNEDTHVDIQDFRYGSENYLKLMKTYGKDTNI